MVHKAFNIPYGRRLDDSTVPSSSAVVETVGNKLKKSPLLLQPNLNSTESQTFQQSVADDGPVFHKLFSQSQKQIVDNEIVQSLSTDYQPLYIAVSPTNNYAATNETSGNNPTSPSDVLFAVSTDESSANIAESPGNSVVEQKEQQRQQDEDESEDNHSDSFSPKGNNGECSFWDCYEEMDIMAIPSYDDRSAFDQSTTFLVEGRE